MSDENEAAEAVADDLRDHGIAFILQEVRSDGPALTTRIAHVPIDSVSLDPSTGRIRVADLIGRFYAVPVPASEATR